MRTHPPPRDHQDNMNSSPLPVEDEQLQVAKKRQTPPEGPGFQTGKASTEKHASAPAGPAAQAGQGEQTNKEPPRDPLAVAAYWAHVREVLWISDEELEELEKELEKNQKSGGEVPESPFPNAFPCLDHLVASPDFAARALRGNQRNDSDASQRSLDGQRRWLESTRKQAAELDEYLKSKGIDTSPTSPVSAVASPMASPSAPSANMQTSSAGSPDGERCSSCCKPRLSSVGSGSRSSAVSTQSRPPQRPHMNLSRDNSGRISEPPVLGEKEQKGNFF